MSTNPDATRKPSRRMPTAPASPQPPSPSMAMRVPRVAVVPPLPIAASSPSPSPPAVDIPPPPLPPPQPGMLEDSEGDPESDYIAPPPVPPPPSVTVQQPPSARDSSGDIPPPPLASEGSEAQLLSALPEATLQVSRSGTLHKRPKPRMSIPQLVRHTPAALAGVKDSRSARVLAWGSFEQRYEAERAALEPILRFPESPPDVRVVCSKRPTRLVLPRLRAELRTDRDLEPYVRSCIDECFRDCLTVEHNDSQHGVARNSFGSQRTELPGEFFASGLGSGGLAVGNGGLGSEARRTLMLPAGSTPVGERRLSTEGAIGRALDSGLILPPSAMPTTARGGGVLLDVKSFGHQRLTLTVAVKAFRLMVGEIEPLWCTASVYDLERRAKVSEDFHFHLNTNGLMTSCGLEGLISQSGSIKHASITLSGPSPHLCLVVKAFRLLRGEVDKDIGLFLKGKLDTKQVRSEVKEWALRNNVSAATGATGAVPLPLQPYLWAPLMLFNLDETGIRLTQMHRSETIYPVHGVLTDEALYEAMAIDVDRPKKLKSLTGLVEIDVTPQTDASAEFFGHLDNCFVPVEPFSRGPEMKPLKELADFSLPPHPFTEYVNNLYVYPESLVVKHSGHSHLQISLQLVDAAQLASPQPTSTLDSVYPPLYAYASSPDSVTTVKLLKEANSTVQWSESRPQFADEFKLSLPPKLRTYHLLFTFYTINTTGKTLRSPVGYSAVPLFKDGIALKTGRYNLLVCRTTAELVAPASSGTQPPTAPVPEAESKKYKHIFTFRLLLDSSVFPQDDAVTQFLRETAASQHQRKSSGGSSDLSASGRSLSAREPEGDAAYSPPLTATDSPGSGSTVWKDGLRSQTSRGHIMGSAPMTAQLAALAALDDATPAACSQFFYPIMKGLLRGICMWGDQVARQTFLHIIVVLKKIFTIAIYRGTESENQMLKSYVQKVFDPSAISQPGRLLHELLVKHWVDLLAAEHVTRPGPNQTSVDGPFNWFLLEIIAKATAVYAVQTKRIETDTNRQGRFPTEFQMNVCKLAVELLKGYGDSLKANDPTRGVPLFVNIRAVPLFFNAMFPLIDRGLLLNTIYSYMSTSDPMNEDPVVVNTVKFTILKTIADYEHYIPINLPSPIPETLVDNVSGLDLVFWQRNPLVGIVLHEVSSCVMQRNPTNRQQGIKTLRDLLRKHSIDPRYQAPEIQARIASMYFPLVLMLIPNMDTIASLDDSQQRDLLLCFLYVLRWCPIGLLRAWWSKDTQKRHVMFFSLLHHCVDKFKDTPQQTDVCEIACRLCTEFAIDRTGSLCTARDPVFQVIFDVLILSFSQQREATIGSLLAALSVLLQKLPEQFYVFLGNSHIDGISYEILRFVNTAIDTQQPHVESMVALFSSMLAQNFDFVKDTKRMKVQVTLAASRLVVEEHTIDTSKLLRFFKMIDIRAASDAREAFRKSVNDVTARICSLLNYHAKIKSTTDPDTLADLYYETALGYDESPDLRVAWLENLATRHAQNENWEEAAHTKIFVALLVAKYLAVICHMPLDPSDFARLTPNVQSPLSDTDIKLAHDSGQFQSNVWSLDALVLLLKQSCTYLVKGGLYEHCIEIYSVLAAIFKRERNYVSMIETLTENTQMCQILVAKEREREARLFARYYRVAFFGKAIGDELSGRDFIYKRPATSNLSLMQQQMKDFLAGKVSGGAANVVLLPNRTVDQASLDPAKAYFQMVSVEPHFEGAEAESRVTSFDTHFGARKFIAVQAFTEEGKKAATENMKEQRKKKTIYEVEIAFPFVKCRLPVVSRREIVLEPIETAIELILERCDKIREQLECNPPKINPLQQVLQGSVVPMVNQGPLKICEVFLSDEGRRNERPELIEKLSQAMGNFVELCAAAIQLNQGLIGPRHIKFHEMIEQHYTDLYDKIAKCLAPRRKPKRTFTKEDIDRKAWREQQKVTI